MEVKCPNVNAEANYPGAQKGQIKAESPAWAKTNKADMSLNDEREFSGSMFSFMDLGFTRCPLCNDLISREEAEKTYRPLNRTIHCPSCQEEIGIKDLLTN